jgi:RND family efflux transporter MFP subunit
MKRNSFVVFLVVLIVLAVVGLFGWQRMTASAASATRPQTVAVQRGSLVATVNAAGNVSTPEEATMAFQSTGRVSKVNVQVGDIVKKGQVLMELDSTDQQLALRTAQASLVSAQASYDSAKLKAAQNPDQAIAAKAALDKANIALQQAQGAYNSISWRGDVSQTTQAATLQQATIDYNTALANYRIALSNLNDTSLRQAQAAVDNAQVGVEQAQRNLDKMKLVAPMDGAISQVNFSMGDTAGSTTAVALVDVSNLQVKVTIAEVDMAKLSVGETAQMTLDALPGKNYTAKVIAISPIGTITQGVVNYPVIVAITDADGSIKPGMTANLAVVVDRRENVLLLPTRAVRSQGTQKIVTVAYKGQNIQVPVQTGLSNDTSIEITSGLQEGDQVLLNQTTTTSGTRGLGGGAFFVGRPD